MNIPPHTEQTQNKPNHTMKQRNLISVYFLCNVWHSKDVALNISEIVWRPSNLKDVITKDKSSIFMWKHAKCRSEMIRKVNLFSYWFCFENINNFPHNFCISSRWVKKISINFYEILSSHSNHTSFITKSRLRPNTAFTWLIILKSYNDSDLYHLLYIRAKKSECHLIDFYQYSARAYRETLLLH